MTRPDTAIRRTVTVKLSADRAFNYFTNQMASWWPAANTWAGRRNALETVVVEPRQGGRWFERATDGVTTDWGRVLAWEPGRRVVLSWQISPEWQPEPDPAKASEIEVRFVDEGPSSCRVELVHGAFDKHGPGGDSIRVGLETPDGWTGLLNRFAQTAR